MELAQAVMDTTDRNVDRNTVCTINELLGAMPGGVGGGGNRSTQRTAADLFMSQLSDNASKPGPSNTVQQNNNKNMKDNFAEECDEEDG